MAKKISFYYSYTVPRLELEERSRAFFAQFPDVTEELIRSTYKGGEPGSTASKALGGGEGEWQLISAYVGSAILSSAAIAAAIKAWIQGRRRKIVISIDGTSRKLEYEGPSLSHDIKEVELIIEKFADQAGERRLCISATESPDNLPAPPSNIELKD